MIKMLVEISLYIMEFPFISDEDEVGDRITVRSDDELKAMLSYVSSMSDIYVKLFVETLDWSV